MHFGLRKITVVVFFCTLVPGVWAQDKGGFDDFKEEIILKDKKNDSSDLDFMEKENETEAPKKTQNVDDEGVLENLEKEVEKSKAGEKKDAKKAEEAPQKRTLKQKEEDAPAATSTEAEDELLLKEEEQEQADIEKDEKPKAAEKPQAPDDLEGVGQDQDLKAIEEQESEMQSDEKTTEAPAQSTTEEATEDSMMEEAAPAPSRPSRKWARPGGPIVLPKEEQEEGEPVIVGDVEIEPDYYTGKVVKKCNCRYDALVPYSLRRESWSTTFGLGMNTYSPSNFDPDAFTDDFETVYGSAETPMIELNLGLKKNFDFGAIAVDLGGAYYTNTGSTSDTNLTMKFVSLALNLYLDNLFSEPYVVPYGVAGLAEVFYDETLEGNEAGGGSSSVYFGGGLLFQLDWMDEQANIDSYEDFGLENTFLFVEGRLYTDLKVSFGDDPNPADLSSENIALLAGLKFEF